MLTIKLGRLLLPALAAASYLSAGAQSQTSPQNQPDAVPRKASAQPMPDPSPSQPEKGTPPKKTWFDNITFKGYMQLDATSPQGNSVQGSVSNFRIRRARPTFVVGIDPLTRAQIQFDVSTGKCGTGNSVATVTDTYAERRVPGFGLVQFGQNLIPFSREVYEDNAAIRSPLELSFAAESVALLERDIGIYVKSPQPPDTGVTWQVALVNGQGFRTADANANKTIVGRVVAPACRYLRVGVSAIDGTYSVSGKDWDRKVMGYEFYSPLGRALQLSGEFYHAKFVDNPTTPTKVADFDGGYVLAETWIGSLKSIPFFRYQRTYGDLDYRSFDFGWRYQYAANQRLTLEYDVVNGHQRDFAGARWQLGF